MLTDTLVALSKEYNSGLLWHKILLIQHFRSVQNHFVKGLAKNVIEQLQFWDDLLNVSR